MPGAPRVATGRHAPCSAAPAIVDLSLSSTPPDADLPGDRRVETAPDGVADFRRLLKIENERLRMRHRLGRGGRDIAAARSAVVDAVVGRACARAAAECAPALPPDQEEVAVVALGGYGRRELAPFSDVDLLFLRAERADDEVTSLVERALALLWDCGLGVSHGFRTVAECVAMAREDLHARTALTEARLLAGSPRLFQDLLGRLDEVVFANPRATASFLDALRQDVEDRYARFGRTVGLLEPHVKEGAGGLRDRHVILWIGHALFGARGLTALRERAGLADHEGKAILRAYDHLCHVRNEAHFTTGRKTDLLDLELQPVLAESLGYRPRRGMQASEIFMRDYYERAAELHRISRAFLLRHAPAPRRAFSLALTRPRPRGTFEIRDGKLHPRGDAAALGSARRLLQAFAIAQREGPELSEELKLDIRASLRLVDRPFRESREAGRVFLGLLSHRGRVGVALRGMHETGLLGRLLPEFARVTFLVQHDHYHRYTVDEHILAAIDALDRVAAPPAEAALGRLPQVFDEVVQPAALYLGVLLHDIGKGRGSGHVRTGARLAERMCARLGVEAGLAADVVFLVEAHREMSQLSQRRDLREPGLVEVFARAVSTLDRLNMLFLLTHADQCGVGPGVWNEWKAALLWDLYERTRAHLTPSSGWPEAAADGARERARRQLDAEFPAPEVERHFALLPERYLRITDAADIVRHFRLVQRLEETPVAAQWHAAGHATDLVVVTRDHPGLFAQLAGTLTGQGLDILSVDAYTREDGIALDIFKVRDVVAHGPVAAARHAGIEMVLRSAVEGGHDVAAAVEKRRGAVRRRPKRALVRPRVAFDAAASATSTVIEVRAEDEPGLAFRIARVLSAHGLDIALAKIATEKSHALDVFYVRGPAGGKLAAEECARVEAALLGALDPRLASAS
jgi:[protein-PII] uridylyltransferase